MTSCCYQQHGCSFKNTSISFLCEEIKERGLGVSIDSWLATRGSLQHVYESPELISVYIGNALNCLQNDQYRTMRAEVKGQQINSSVLDEVRGISENRRRSGAGRLPWGVLVVAVGPSNTAEQLVRQERLDGVCFVIELLLTCCLFPGWWRCIWSSDLSLKESSSFIRE